MAQLQGFPSCCGAQILTGLYPEQNGLGPIVFATNMPAKEDFTYFTVAITNPTQHNSAEVVKALKSRGFEQVLEFRGNGDTQLHLWAQGRAWKPLAGAKGNMKQEKPGCSCSSAAPESCKFCLAVQKEVKRQVARIDKYSHEMKIPRQPAGKKSQARRSTHGRGSTRSSRTETSA